MFGTIDDTRPEETPIPASLSNAFAIRHVSIDYHDQLPDNQLETVKYLLPVTGVPAHTTVPKDLEYSELAQNTGARYYMGELGSLVTCLVRVSRLIP